MSAFDRTAGTNLALPAPATSVSNWTVDDIRKSDILVFRENRKEYVDTVIAPNGFQVGLLDEAFLTDLLVTGHITGSGIIYSELGFSGSLQTLVDGTNYLRAGNGISVSNNSDGSITIANTGSGGGGTSYTAGSGMSLSGTQFSVNKDNTTITVDGNNNLAVQKVPNLLSAGNGLNSTTYDGSQARSLTVKAAAATPVTVSTAGVGMSITNLNALSLQATDEILIQKSGTFAKTTVQDILNLVPSSSGSSPTSAAYLVAQSSSDLSNERILIGGDGISATDNASAGNMTVSVALKSSGGLEFVNGQLAIKVADFIGFGLSQSGGQIIVDTNALAGAGLTVVNNQLAVNFGSSSSSVVKGSNTLSINPGDGLSLGGIAILGNPASSVDLEIRSEDIRGTGFSVANNNLDLYIKGTGGITVTTGSADSNGIPIIIDAASVEGGGGGGSGTIGAAEDGTYTDGLFTDFTNTTPVGTAVDRFNELFKFLVPKTAPDLSSIDLDTTTGVTGILSFGTSNTISGISNVLVLEDQPAIDVNGSYASQTSSGGHRRAGIYGTAVELVGDLASAVPVDLTGNGNTNYPAKSFGKGNLGSLILEINGSDVKTIDLTSGTVGSGASGSGSGSELTSGTGFFELSAATGGKYNSGDPYDLEKHRTGKWKIAAASQRAGWNYMRVKHVIESTTYATKYIQWVVDSVSTNGQINLGTPALSSLALTGSKHLSGVEYYTGGTATYAVSVGNFYTNVYSTSNITLDSSVIAPVVITPSSINTSGGQDESKSIAISETVTIDATTLLNSSLSVSLSATHPTKNAISSQAAASLSNLLVYNIAEASSNVLKTTENMDGESFRLESGTYATQSAVSSGAFDSTVSLATNSGLQVWNRKLVAPIQSTNSGDFNAISNGPAGNPDYSGLTTGTKTYFRKFTNTKGGSSSNFTLEIDGSGTIVDNTTSLTGDKLQIFMKVPGTGTNVTGWMDLSSSFVTGAYSDNDGCYVEAFDNSINSSILFTSGIKFIENGDHIVIKIVADGSWTGHIDELRFTWR